MIKTQEINNQEIWESKIHDLQPHSFLQSWSWGEFNKLNGHKVYRWGFYKDEELIGLAQVIFHKAKRGSFLLCPHGPLVLDVSDYEQCISSLMQSVKEVDEYKNCSFVRLCTLLPNEQQYYDLFSKMGFRNAPIHQHPELSWMIDINRDDDQILQDMRKTTRHAIRKGEKDGVKIEISNNIDDVERFWDLYKETVQRQKFIPFSKEYLKKEFEIFKASNKVVLGFAIYEGKVVSGAIIVFDGGGAYYHHGASLHTGNVPTSQLLQWKLIQEAKRRGCNYYNFWGIAPPDKPKHPWAGLSVFKKGFGGFEEAYLHAQDFALSPKYYLNYVVERVRKWRRKL